MMVVRWNKKTGKRTVCYPYTKEELFEMNKWVNAPPITILSDRRRPVVLWDDDKRVELVKKYYIAYKENLGLKYHQKDEALAKFDSKQEAESAVNELKAQNPSFTDWEIKLHAFPR